MNPLYRNDTKGQYPPSWYAASTDIPPARPALRGDAQADVCVIGAGFTGLSAALHLARAGLDVVVLDAHRVGFGASGRNGGQVGSGYNMSQRDLEKRCGTGNARLLWELAEEAKADIRENCQTLAPDARFTPGVAHGFYTRSEADSHARDAAHLADTYGYDQIETLSPDAMRAIVKTPLYQGGELDMGAGHIHPLRYVFGLARAAEAAGARIFEGSEVHHIAHGDPAHVRTGAGQVRANHVVIAGNGYLPNIERKIAARVMPINSFICATEPLGDRAAEVLARDIAVADSKFVVNYYRMSEDKRFLFGGRESYSIGYPGDIQTALVHRMVTLFPQLAGVKIDHVWGGTLGITMPRLPAVQRIAPNVISAGGFSGHGVALSGLAGKVMAEAVRGQADRFDTLGTLKVPNFPGGAAFRAPLLTLAMTWYALRDRIGL
ncbi:NAD(P)/FAD-dependent oxidoreductase [Yoonia sediminilitoris]|uniref:Gamma-glutamylputrescine oxidase n=1 Tax=Yoonia sediminilitoris TaxID=1286148 RepID=A0A2T6KQB0_9RHOB|nr:FAD-binding oxidoreductase [Yoonia sediminilitoris]PUB18743.1 gamma-glutamylputrescine oxidase [Yoonia sediminilitoris]RCW98911.1 gamma-glutamylputrescine oxidase [Yoonia sediminilitoris]